jgi:hypothetical protein
MDIIKQKNAYFLSHNGLGDNITSIGAVNFLLNYYETIFFLCKDIHEDNVKLLFTNKPVIIVAFDSKNETNDCRRIIHNIHDNETNIFISGYHTGYLKKKITSPELLKYIQNDSNYSIKYQHIRNFYYDNNLDLSIYFNYFHIASSKISKEYYDDLENHKIVFLHTKASNREINLDDIIKKYENNNDYIIICANKNIYNMSNIKYEIADKYVNIKVAYYIDIIKNAEIIHVIDSCFSCIVYPLITSKQITPIECIIHER